MLPPPNLWTEKPRWDFQASQEISWTMLPFLTPVTWIPHPFNSFLHPLSLPSYPASGITVPIICWVGHKVCPGFSVLRCYGKSQMIFVANLIFIPESLSGETMLRYSGIYVLCILKLSYPLGLPKESARMWRTVYRGSTGQTWKGQISLLPTFCWLEFIHVGGWEILSHCPLLRKRR